MNVEPPETLVIIESIVYKSNGFAITLLLTKTKWKCAEIGRVATYPALQFKI
jgi:hypothetical protein